MNEYSVYVVSVTHLILFSHSHRIQECAVPDQSMKWKIIRYTPLQMRVISHLHPWTTAPIYYFMKLSTDVTFFFFFHPAGGFLVVVQKTDAAARCGLQGTYRLLVGQDALSLTESENSRTIWSWSYRHLRRYGNDHVRQKCPQWRN